MIKTVSCSVRFSSLWWWFPVVWSNFFNPSWQLGILLLMLKNPCLSLYLEVFYLRFSSSAAKFRVLHYDLWSVLNWFFFCVCVRAGWEMGMWLHSSTRGHTVSSQQQFEKSLCFPMCICWRHCQKLSGSSCVDLFLGPLFLSIDHGCFLPVLYFCYRSSIL